jgi:signal transduction histidine kinase
VDDTGRGIPDAERPHLFTAFYREPAVAHEVPGTGLGLAFCKGAVEGMGGRIWYERSALGGSAFCVALPA